MKLSPDFKIMPSLFQANFQALSGGTLRSVFTRRAGAILGWLGLTGCYALVTLPLLLRYPPVWPDEALFASPSDSLARGSGMGTPVLAGFIPGMDRYTFWLPPGYFLALAALFRIFHPVNQVLVMRLFSWALGAALLGICWHILRRISPRSGMVWLSLLLLATHATLIRAANLGRMDMLTLVCGTASVALYLEFLEREGSRWAAGAGFFAGLAFLCHPAGAVFLAALVANHLKSAGLKSLAKPQARLFFGSFLLPLVPWLIYLLRAPGLFLLQFGGQLNRKASATGTLLIHEPATRWLIRPLQFAEWGPKGPLTFSDVLFVFVFLVAVLLLAFSGREKTRASVLGLWVLAGYCLNLATLEDWYPIYFVVPMVLLLGWGAASTQYPWARAIGVAALLVGIAWNVVQAELVLKGPFGDWKAYRKYASALAEQIPAGSKVILMAIPDPYFGLQMENKGYRLYEFAPEGIPVDPTMAQKTLASTDYAVDSGCCGPRYLRPYIESHGRIVGGVMSPDRNSPPVMVWKLQDSAVRRPEPLGIRPFKSEPGASQRKSSSR